MATRPKPWQVAVHEGGHAVATVVLKGSVHQVSVRRARLTAGRCWHDVHELTAMDQAIVSLSGPAAQLFVAEHPDADHTTAVIDGGGLGDEGDWANARALADEHGFDVDDASERAATLVLDHWPAIEAVARALRGSHRGLVSGERVAEIVARVPSRPRASSGPTPPSLWA